MLVTIYKVLYPGLEQVDQYYKWRHDVPETRTVRESRSGPPKKIRGTTDCPGCGRTLSYNVIMTDGHKCPGTLTDYPVKPRGAKGLLRPSREELEQHWRDYEARNAHQVTFSSDPDS
jgi:hypothetical protein